MARQTLTVGYSAAAAAERAAYRDYAQRRAQAAAIIYSSCGATARAHIDISSDPAEMWTVLGARMDGANNTVGRMTLSHTFSSLHPTPGQPITNYFGQLLDIRNQLVGTAQAITDSAFKTHIFTTLPPMFAVTIKILQSQANLTIEEVFDALKECEKNKAMAVVPDAVSEALCTHQGGRGGSQQRGRGGRGAHHGRGNHQGKEHSQRWCDWCMTGTDMTANCWNKDKNNKRAQDHTLNDCYYCGEEGHTQTHCALRNSRASQAQGGNRWTQDSTGN